MDHPASPVMRPAAKRCAWVPLLVGLGCRPSPAGGGGKIAASVTVLDQPRRAMHASGRTDDLVLQSAAAGGSLTFAVAADRVGHRPLRGALIDFGIDGSDHGDPLLSIRFGWRDSRGGLHVGPVTVAATECPTGTGVRGEGVIDGVDLTTDVCPEVHAYLVTTRSAGLPVGAALADEVRPAPVEVIVGGGETRGHFFGMSDGGLGMLIEAPGMRVLGSSTRIGEQTFPSPYALEYPSSVAVRSLQIVSGDGLDLLARVEGAAHRVHVGLSGDAGRVRIIDGNGGTLAEGSFPARGRDITLPDLPGATLVLEDSNHIIAARAPAATVSGRFTHPPAVASTLTFHVTDAHAAPLAVHVILRGSDGTPDPNLVAPPGAFVGARSAYLLDGAGLLNVPPGRYHVTVSHGPSWSLLEEDVVMDAGASRAITGALREAITRDDWTTGDFHLHAAPSPDAPVSLDARVASLVCEGIDLAVATDHNHITDYEPSVARLGLARSIVTMPGDEVTSAGKAQWGHFNVYPLAVPSGAAEDGVLPYFDTLPASIFASAHEAGTTLVQVNHPRMDPSIGYFDLVHLDARTGHADATLSDEFDAVEVFNGFWLTSPAKIREGASDLVGLARRGVHVAATGNSDSHHLLYEEAGYPRTYVHVPAEPIATRKVRVLEALRRHDTTVSSGPFVELTVDGQPIGSTVVPLHGTVRVHVRVSAPAWVPVDRVEVWHDDAIAFHASIAGPPHDGVRYETDVDLPFVTDGVLLAWADAQQPLPDVLPYDNARAVGFTGLVYVDADGDGRISLGPG